MKLSMNLAPRLIQVCSICNESVEEHDIKCPYYLLKKLQDAEPVINCPKCKKGCILLNTSDYYECDNFRCKCQFTTGTINVGVADVNKLESFDLIDWQDDKVIKVKLLPDKGKGEMKNWKEIRQLRLRIKSIHEQRRQTKRRYKMKLGNKKELVEQAFECVFKWGSELNIRYSEDENILYIGNFSIRYEGRGGGFFQLYKQDDMLTDNQSFKEILNRLIMELASETFIGNLGKLSIEE
jgi:hypothetical protein